MTVQFIPVEAFDLAVFGGPRDLERRLRPLREGRGDLSRPCGGPSFHDANGRPRTWPRSMAIDSLVSGACVLSGAAVCRSLLFTGVRVNSYRELCEAVVLPEVDIGRHARLAKVVIDRGVRIPPGLVVGEDQEEDARRFRRTDRGVCLITRPMIDRLQT